MIRNHLEELINYKLGLSPTPTQKKLLSKLAYFIINPENDQIFLLKGYAGTGKTSVVSALVQALKSLKISSVLLAPTGRAAKVLAHYAGQPAYTIHKKIYRQKSSTDGFGKFVLDRNLHSNTIFIVDEASMVSNQNSENSSFGSGRLLDDLIEYVYNNKNCKLIIVGDTAQLPPVGLSVSPALEASELQLYGLEVNNEELTEVVRQTGDSGILYNATHIRNLIDTENEVEWHGFFPITTSGFSDIHQISGEDLIETISTSYDKYGREDTMVVTRSNKRANRFNQGIRASILYQESEISSGDLIMVVKNNYYWVGENDKMDFIANGDIAEIVRIGKYEAIYGFRFANVSLRFIDYENVELDCKIFLDTLNLETASFSYEEQQKLYEAVAMDYEDIRDKKKKWEKIRDNEYFNALQVKFAYAVTCHKAQGGQWKSVFIDLGYLTEEMIDREYLRWMYTAFTRPVEQLYLVNFNKEFFEEN